MAALESILPEVEKPARYTGGELNMCKKATDVPIRFLFAFPDVYEVGMSHLGTSILYHMTNEREDTYAEHTCMPFADMAAKMCENNIPLYSLETFTPAAEFDIIGVNLSYEMCYTTALNMLSLAGLSMNAAERDGLPLVIAGGACTCNPEPVADFFDLFVIGEGEEVNNELLDLFRVHKQRGFDKQAFLREASEIEGIYVPSLYTIEYNHDGTVSRIDGKIVKRRIVSNMDTAYFPGKIMVPFVRPVHDRVTLEIFRGCSRGCRFCQAGFIYRPVREKSAETLFKQARELTRSTGYEEMSLSSLSSGDYSHIDELVCGLVNEYAPQRISVSLPSLRVDSFERDYAKKLQGAKKSSFTFAPEAGTQRMRDVINKNVTEEQIMSAVRSAFESGATTIKLYFMLGLPGETTEDVEGIADLVKKIRSAFYELPKEKRRGRLMLHVSTSCFVPKPNTPFQWVAMDTADSLREKVHYLREELRKLSGVKYNWHEIYLSILEAVFARGDRRLCELLRRAVANGAIFDSWQEYFRPEAWENAFAEMGLDKDFYAFRERGYDETLPWSHIDSQISGEYLMRENEAAKRAETTPDCREACNGCGLEGRCGI